MESILFLLPAIGLMLISLRTAKKLCVHAAIGFGTLKLLNLASALTGVLIPVTPVNIALIGFGGLPGLVLLALLQ